MASAAAKRYTEALEQKVKQLNLEFLSAQADDAERAKDLSLALRRQWQLAGVAHSLGWPRFASAALGAIERLLAAGARFPSYDLVDVTTFLSSLPPDHSVLVTRIRSHLENPPKAAPPPPLSR
jgi:hypothetical protein